MKRPLILLAIAFFPWVFLAGLFTGYAMGYSSIPVARIVSTSPPAIATVQAQREPTAIEVAQATQIPTAIRVETLTIVPASPTVEPAPTAISLPTNTPTNLTGLGVTRADLVDRYTRGGYVFDTSSDVDGQPRVTGKESTTSSSVEIIGPSGNIIQASVLIGTDPTDPRSANELRSISMLGLLSVTLPQWNERGDWLANSLEKATSSVENDPVYRIRVDGRNVVLRALKLSGGAVMVLTVSIKDI